MTSAAFSPRAAASFEQFDEGGCCGGHHAKRRGGVGIDLPHADERPRKRREGACADGSDEHDVASFGRDGR